MKKTLSLIIALFCAGQCLAAADQRPNIIFILTDDQTQSAMGAYGNKDIITPNMDKLASQGVRYTNYYATSSICMAGRATVLTGLYEYHHGCNFKKGNLPQSIHTQTYPMLLRKAGYYVAFSGKYGMEIDGRDFDSLAKDFDAWACRRGQTSYNTGGFQGLLDKYQSKYPHATRGMAAWACDTIKDAKKKGKPFCISLSFKAPHGPLTPDPIDLKLYEGKTFATPANFGRKHVEYLSPHVKTSRGYSAGPNPFVEGYQKTIALYYALVTGVDVALGMIRETLDQEGLANNTIIIWTSDNGYALGHHGMGDKILPYEEPSKPPFIIYDPRPGKQIAGSVSPILIGNVDVAPTILSMAGVNPPAKCDGKDLTSTLLNPNKEIREYLPLFNFWGILSAQSMSIVTRQWKYIYWFYDGNNLKAKEELFNLVEDRLETKPIPTTPEVANIVGPLRAIYKQELQKLAQGLRPGAGYEDYPLFFNPEIKWADKVEKVGKEANRVQKTVESGGGGGNLDE